MVEERKHSYGVAKIANSLPVPVPGRRYFHAVVHLAGTIQEWTLKRG